MTQVEEDTGVGRLSSTMVALNDLPIHVGGGYTVDEDRPVVIDS